MRRSKGNRNGSVPPNSTVSVEVEVVRVRNKKPVSLDYLHLKFLTIHAHCSTTLINALQLRTLFTLIATQDTDIGLGFLEKLAAGTARLPNGRR